MLAAMNLLPISQSNPARFGHCSRYPQARFIRTDQNFHICRLGKRHLASIALVLGIISLLLVIFAYHGGYGVGSWFYSLLVVISGLAFVVFGPLLLCRFLMHAYYRQLDSHASSQTDGGSSARSDRSRAPHVYACIIIAPEVVSDDVFDSRLPTYEEAVVLPAATSASPKSSRNQAAADVHLSPPFSGGGTRRAASGSFISATAAQVATSNGSAATAAQINRRHSSGALGSGACAADTGNFGAESARNYRHSSTSTAACCVTDDAPPPSYTDALAQIRVNQLGNAINSQNIENSENSTTVNRTSPITIEVPDNGVMLTSVV